MNYCSFSFSFSFTFVFGVSRIRGARGDGREFIGQGGHVEITCEGEKMTRASGEDEEERGAGGPREGYGGSVWGREQRRGFTWVRLWSGLVNLSTANETKLRKSTFTLHEPSTP